MMRSTPSILLLACLACLACAASPTHTAPTTAEPAAVTPSPRVLSFVPDAGFAPLKLPCVGTEAPAPNGLDDDCDTRIDGDEGAPTSPLSLTLSWPAGSDFALLLTRAGEPVSPLAASTTGVCADDAGFSLLRASFGALEPDAYEVLLLRGKACGARDATPRVVASLWQAQSALGAFAGMLSEGERIRLGVLTVR